MKYKELAQIAEQNGFKAMVTLNYVIVINRDSDIRASISRDQYCKYKIWSAQSIDNFVPASLAKAIAEYADTYWMDREEPDHNVDLWKDDGYV